jgi:LysM repeat protein
MYPTSMRRMVVPVIASVAAGGVAMVFAIQLLHREPPADAHAGSPPSGVSNPASATKHPGPAGLASSRAETDSSSPPSGVSNPASATKHPGPAGVASSRAETDSSPAPPKDSGIPTFDVATIEPTGEAVIAGRAAPGSTVELLCDGKAHGRAVANQSGEFVMVPPQLPPGTYKLALRSTEVDGKQLISDQTIPVSLQPSVDQRPSVALVSPATPTLQQKATVGSTAKAVILDAVRMEPPGQLHVSGRAQPGASVKLYLNDSYIASATAGTDQHFSFTINDGITPGTYRVRVDAVEPKSGVVRAGLEVPFKVPGPAVASSATKDRAQAELADNGQNQQLSVARALPADTGSPSAVVVPKITTTTVVRGDSLWHISRSTYGEGRRYPSIFEANRNKIRNPDLIYPGQIIVLPKR